jgi:NADPH2:quinone reductase
MSLPTEMNAVVITRPGEPEVLELARRPVPQPGAGEILIRVANAGINRPDIVQRQGNYAPPPGAPVDIPGLEIAGEIVACGPDVARWRIGDMALALVPGGGYAEFCIVHGSNALPVPHGLSLVEAAAIPETFFTVWNNVFERGRLAAHEWLLVHGGTSGIGTTAIMLAKAFGAHVIATAGGPDKVAACRALGADEAIDYRTQDFVQATKQASGRGADLILDMVGGDYIGRNYEAAAPDGRIVQIAFMQGHVTTVDFRRLMLKRLTHTGSTLRPRSVEEKAALARALEEKVWPLLAQGRCKPVIHKTLPLAQAAEGHRLMESSRHIGKIVLTIA